MNAAILILLQVLLGVMCIKLMRRQNVSVVLSTSILIYSLLWYVIPILIKTLCGQVLDLRPLVDDDIHIQYALIETVSLLLIIAFMFIPKPYLRWVRESSVAEMEISPRVALLVPIIGIGFGWLITVLSKSVTATYYDRNAFAILGEGSIEYETFGSLSFMQGMLTSFAYACFLVKWPRKKVTILLYISVIVWLLSVQLPYMQSGGRIVLLIPLILLLFYGQVHEWSLQKIARNVGGGLILTVLVGGLISMVVGESRTRGDLQFQDIISKSADTLNSETSKSGAQRILVEVLGKFDSISWGAALVEFAGFDVAGWRPYLGSALSLVPRQLVPDKPVPGSINDSYQGHPTRLIPERLGFDRFSGNVQVSPAAISMWQFGYWGLLGFVLCNALSLYFINSLLLSPFLLPRVFAIFLIGIPGFYTFIASPDVLMLNFQRVMLAFVVLTVVRRVLGYTLRVRTSTGSQMPISLSGTR